MWYNDKNITREWKTSSDNQGLWKFTTIELLESGIYHLFTRAQDVRGALSEFSPKQDIEVIFSGLAIGPLLITFRNLVLILAIILSASVILVVYFIQKNIRSRKKLKRETKEAEESLHKGFSELKEDIVKEVERLEGVKTKKELNEAEKKVVENLRKDLEEVEKYISKEIKDVEKELE